ncbi:FAD-dependent pyridine nucleotide-disulfide oxidoreductase [Fusarium albosuccineum]|uniref:FAD-dependent pyridine nucleotide-disulfide oxidoreductase n=1 Tax=Fusarium albosuccineum TaxID=1237068 RepID=A0A8H4LA24_9HYPO|nr:FAD-dependent pyridine nucleotide-disulfide oxidoreductase [Fusarium albosuccineum]
MTDKEMKFEQEPLSTQNANIWTEMALSNHPATKLISGRAIDAPRPLKVIYIGAGVSGILAAILFRKAVPSLDLVIYEKNPEIGGTWFENRYPGCACDIPSHAYQLSFESWTDWNHFYAGAPEILEYWKKVADKYNVREHIVRLQKVDADPPVIIEDEADVFITGTGLLNEWKWPSIPGLHSFTGEILHTANWQDSFSAVDKRVAVIGAGSSGIQVVPALAPKVEAMDHYIRGKTWISNQLSEDILKARTTAQHSSDGATNFVYEQKEKDLWKKDPSAYIAYRKELEFRLQGNYEVTQRDSPRHHLARSTYEKNMRERLKERPELLTQLLPDFPPLCKRLTPGPGYLEALTTSHVSTISEPIAYIDSTAIVTKDGIRRPVDAIICATGFETSPGSGFPIYGRDGINLREKYKSRPKSYLGLCTDNFPNFFQSLGPNSFQGAGSLLIMMEYTHQYMAKILHRLAYGNVRTIEPKRRQVENFTNYCDEYFQKTVYTSDCISWYKTFPTDPNEKPRVTALWPGSSIHAIRALESVRWEDYDMEVCDGNDFGWFGNGSTCGEKDIGDNIEDLTWYLDQTEFLHHPVPSGTTKAV